MPSGWNLAKTWPAYPKRSTISKCYLAVKQQKITMDDLEAKNKYVHALVVGRMKSELAAKKIEVGESTPPKSCRSAETKSYFIGRAEEKDAIKDMQAGNAEERDAIKDTQAGKTEELLEFNDCRSWNNDAIKGCSLAEARI